MQYRVHRAHQPCRGRVEIPGSESMTNRALLIAALAEGVSQLSGILISDDTLALITALHSLGLAIHPDMTKKTCIVGGCGGIFPIRQATIWCADAAPMAHFLLAACAANTGVYHFDGSLHLQGRSLRNLLEALCMQGAVVVPHMTDRFPLSIRGADRFQGGTISVDGSTSSLAVSALLMAAPFARSQLIINTHDLISRPFVRMTCAMMAESGVLVHRLHFERFSIPVPQRYLARDSVIEPDLGTAAFFFAAAAVTGGEVTIQSICVAESKQGDAKFLKILQKMGCEVREETTGLTVRAPQALVGVSVDMRDCEDSVLALAVIAPFATTPTTITNIGHMRLQESDRIRSVRTGLEAVGVTVEEGGDWLRIHPSQPIAGVVHAGNDHRLVMAFAVIGLRVDVTIEDAQCVSRICPDFFKLWESLYVG